MCRKMFALVFTIHQKRHVLHGFPCRQKLNGKKDSILCPIHGLYQTKKENKFVDLHDERIKYFGHLDILMFKTCM